MTKLPIKLKGVWDFKISKAEFKSIIYNNITINEFEEKWHAFIQKYDVQHRLWFHNLYLEKEKWITTFPNHYFWAGMMSTQRSESIHAFFMFVEQYELVLRFKYEKELQAEDDSRKKHAMPCSGFEWDFHLQTHYTRPIYDAFATEHMKRLYHCEIERHHDFNAMERVEKNCDVVLDNNAKYVDFKNVLKGRFNAYCNWNNDMAVPSVGGPYLDEDVTFIRNPREVRTRGRPPTNRCRRGGGK
ncbi:hypothetical protein H5410_049659 [Solanum commersonii]|uniref:Protein FAR1-RELATED SEQUENCE n=1 Tax=Solanum commersonii TaxID=4109 RepID=A0A9J5WVM6_SOLCO|nr:hypothetical protein H5410_049659 [Solanum commersonii]